jgi:beta-fructofuranosidase
LKAGGALVAAAALGDTLSTASFASPDSRAMKTKLARDPRRPQFHLLPAANWMNDPNGPIYWNGRYHMFFQYNPDGAYWGDMHWAHAVSPDIVHWKHLPIALSPTPGGPDGAGCFSGTAVIDNGVVNALYTGVTSVSRPQSTVDDGVHSFRETQCLATSTDPELKTWTKLTHPVIAAPPPALHDVAGFRDPSPWRAGDWWYLALGSGVRRQYGDILLYRSRDLRNWEYLHLLASGASSGRNTTNSVDAGDMWECPDFFALDGKHVLIYSTMGKVHWHSGVLDEKEMRFHSEKSGLLDYGAYYAAKTQLASDGSHIVWGWITETRLLAEYKAAGWAGMMSLPRVLRLDRDGWLRVEFSPAVQSLRRGEQKLTLTPEQGTIAQLARFAIENATGELLAKFERGAAPFALELIGTLPQGPISEPLVTLRYDPKTPDQILADGIPIPIHGEQHRPLEVHIYVDGSVAEVVLQGAAAYTKRFYYPGPVAPTVQLRFRGRPQAIASLSLWQIEPISPDRLTS